MFVLFSFSVYSFLFGGCAQFYRAEHALSVYLSFSIVLPGGPGALTDKTEYENRDENGNVKRVTFFSVILLVCGCD